MKRKDLIVLVLYSISRHQENEISALWYFDYIVFIKFVDIPPKLYEIETKLHISESLQNWLKLVKLEVFVIMLAHIAGLKELEQKNYNWLRSLDLEKASIEEHYLMSLYYMIITMTTTGYGDIAPTTMVSFNLQWLGERGYMIIVALLATNICAYSFSQISEIVKFESTKKQSFNQMMIEINYQMKARGLSMSLQHKVRKSIEYQHYLEKHSTNITDQIINNLPSQLKKEVLLDLNREIINDIKLFQNLSPKCVEQISLSLKQKILMPEEILLYQYQLNENLYYVNKGFLEVSCIVKESKGKPVSKNILKLQVNNSFTLYYQINFKKNKEIFGYEGFLFGQETPFGVKSSGTSVVSYIEKNLLQEILVQFPVDNVNNNLSYVTQLIRLISSTKYLKKNQRFNNFL